MLVLFDIDGTLMLRAAAEHAQAVLEAIDEVWSVTPGERLPVEAAGRTDTEIAREILLLHGTGAREIDARLDDFRAAAVRRYAELVPDAMSELVAPGATRALEILDAREGVRLSLVTGNMEGVARLKLRAGGLGAWFATGQGGFGSDSEDRTDLPPIARARAASWNGGEPWPAESTVVVGDTPRDIACARADGAHVIAVTTGPFSAAELGDADAVIEDLRALPDALAQLRVSRL